MLYAFLGVVIAFESEIVTRLLHEYHAQTFGANLSLQRLAYEQMNVMNKLMNSERFRHIGNCKCLF